MEAWPGTSADDRDQEDDSRFSEAEAPRSGAGSTHAPFSPGARLPGPEGLPGGWRAIPQEAREMTVLDSSVSSTGAQERGEAGG